MKRIFRLPGDPERPRQDAEAEIRFHIEQRTERLIAEGMDPDAARREAERRFGDVEAVREEIEGMTRKREGKMKRGDLREGWSRDVAYAVRQLLRNPVFAAVAIVTLALGIGVNTAIFSVVDGILFRPLPYPEPEELVNVWTDVTARGGPPDEWLSYANYNDLAERSMSLEALGAWGGGAQTWTDPSEPEQLLGVTTTWDMFSAVLNVEPAIGRHFESSDALMDAPGVALISHGFWQRAFGGDESVVGRTLTLNESSVMVVGVMPSGFRPPFVPNADIWRPVQIDLGVQQGRRSGFSWRALGRMAEGATVGRVENEMRELGTRLEREYPESNTDMTFTAVALRDDLVSDARAGLLVLLGAVGLVLLVACVNVANLLLARASARQSELAVRAALGAGRARLTRQLLTESVVLAVVGGVAGIAMAWPVTDLLVRLAPEGTPRIDAVTVDARVLAFTALITMLSGLVFGMVPAIRGARADIQDALREGGRGQLARSGAALRNGLVVAQVALALVLLVGAGLLVQSFQNLRTADLGFRADGVATFRINLPPARYQGAPELANFASLLEERLAAIPGVRSVGSTSTVPLTGFDGDASFHIEGREIAGPGASDAAWLRQVTPGYLPTMGIQIVQGRGFTEQDVEGDREVLVINETMAARIFPGENPVGQRLTFSDPTNPEAFYREIVGVARDIRNFGIREGSRYAAYLPWAQAPGRAMFPMLQVEGPLDPVMEAVRVQVRELDPGLAVAQVTTMDEIVRSEVAADRFVATLLGLFAGVALVLAVIGLYGVVSYGVSTRIREMGVRMALGAGRGRISAMVVKRSLMLVSAGIVLGLVTSSILSSLVTNLLFGVEAMEPFVIGSVTLLLGLAASAAALIPALRATRIDPTSALRAD